MEMILNENDMVVGVEFENGTIQDYVDNENRYGLIRVEETTANWFLFNKDDSPEDIQDLYEKILKEDHHIKDEFGEEVVLFNKQGKISFEKLVEKIDAYLDNELGSMI